MSHIRLRRGLKALGPLPVSSLEVQAGCKHHPPAHALCCVIKAPSQLHVTNTTQRQHNLGGGEGRGRGEWQWDTSVIQVSMYATQAFRVFHATSNVRTACTSVCTQAFSPCVERAVN